MNPGIYANMSFADYVAIDALNKSTFWSPGKVFKGSKSTDLGTALHLRMLERGERVAVHTDTHSRNTKAYKEWAKEQAADVLLLEEENASVLGMEKAVRADSRAMHLVKSALSHEVVVVWVDPETGRLCKMRADGIDPNFDLKSTRSMSGFVSDAIRLGYLAQAAFYHDGMFSMTGTASDFSIIAVESSPPYEVQVWKLGEFELEIGRRQYREALEKYIYWKEHGHLPANKPRMFPIPSYIQERYAQ